MPRYEYRNATELENMDQGLLYGLPSVAQHEKFRRFLLWFCWILSFVISELIKYLISWPCLTKARILCLDSLHSIIA
jgi:hypothetical protein